MWIEIEKELPQVTGWYHIRLKDGSESVCPFVSDVKGKLSWLVYDPSFITHWYQK